jgi:hypothetical protein
MPLREDERARHRKEDSKYCVFCEAYLSPAAWAEHEHNPNAGKPVRPVRAAPPPLATSLLLGNCAIGNTSGVLVIEGLEVFRVRHRGGDGLLAVDFDVRGRDGARLARIERNRPVVLAPGYALHAADGEVRVADERTGAPLACAAAEPSGRGVRVTGDFHVNGMRVTITGDTLVVGGMTVAPARLYGPGTAVLLRKDRGIAFAKR